MLASPFINVHINCCWKENSNDSVAQWIRRWSTKPEILGSIPSYIFVSALLVFSGIIAYNDNILTEPREIVFPFLVFSGVRAYNGNILAERKRIISRKAKEGCLDLLRCTHNALARVSR